MTLQELKAMRFFENIVVLKSIYAKDGIVRVPNGWIYQTSTANGMVSNTFIPEPKESEAKEGVCRWVYESDDGHYDSWCSDENASSLEQPDIYHFNYCPYCGKKIEVMK